MESKNNILPAIKKAFLYLQTLTDQHGILQFTKEKEKLYQAGYAIEDQARGVIIALLLGKKSFAQKLLRFIMEARHNDHGILSLKTYDGKLHPSGNNDEACGQVIWALARSIKSSIAKRDEVEEFLSLLIERCKKSSSPRAWAYAILGLAYLEKTELISFFSDRLVQLYKKNRDEDWQWFEEYVTYANALLPYSLVVAYNITSNKFYLKIAKKTFLFLANNLIIHKKPYVVGNMGWWHKGQTPALFDQQPIDVSLMVLCAFSLFKTTKNYKFAKIARFFYSWFFGNNILGVKMLREDGACFDGLTAQGVNKNAGAESTICFLLASWAVLQIMS